MGGLLLVVVTPCPALPWPLVASRLSHRPGHPPLQGTGERSPCASGSPAGRRRTGASPPACGPRVALADQHSGVMDGPGQAPLQDLRLQAPLREVLQLQAQDASPLRPARVQHADRTPNAVGSPVQRQQHPGSPAHLGQGKSDRPDLTLVPKPVPAGQLQLLVEAWPLGGSPRGYVAFATKSALGHRRSPLLARLRLSAAPVTERDSEIIYY